MKRSVLIALAAFALAGCAKESVVDSALTNAGNAIGFNTYSNITRGNPFDNNPEFAASGNVFGVTAFISTSDSPYMGKADAGTEIVSDGTKWDYKNTSDIRYWPTQGETLSFYAYAPYTKNGVAIPVAYTKGDGMIMTDYTVPADDAGQVDLMYASALNVAKASPAVKVPLQFKHAMTQVRFKAKAKGDGVFIDVKENGIKLSNLKSKGTFTLSAAGAASWSITEGNLTEYTAVFPETKEITNVDAKNLYDADKALILLPQYLFGSADTYADYTVPFSSKKVTGDTEGEEIWKMNKRITYTLTVTGNLEPILFETSVVDWEDSNADMEI